MSIWNESLVEGNNPSRYKYALRLDRNYFIDLTSIATLTKARRGFTIWKWCTLNKPDGIKFANSNKHNVTVASGWRKLITFKKGKWEREEEDNSYISFGSPMMPAHMFFKDTEEFKEFIGEKYMLKIFADLL